MDTPEPLVVAIPTHDTRAPVTTILELLNAAHRLSRPPIMVTASGSNIPRARNGLLGQLRGIFPDEPSHRVLWVDSDIVIPRGGSEHIASAIRWADDHAANIVANYTMLSGQAVVMKSRVPTEAYHYTDPELAALPDFSEIGMGGLGFAYLQQPLRYVFHADLYGEDVNFWMDNPGLHIHLAKNITLGHQKDYVLWAAPQPEPAWAGSTDSTERGAPSASPVTLPSPVLSARPSPTPGQSGDLSSTTEATVSIVQQGLSS